MKKKTISLILILAMMFTCVMSAGFAAAAEDVDIIEEGYDASVTETGADYGLGQRIEDGNILHCFNWTLSQIKQELPNIAAAGFTAVQTSPLQKHDGSTKWYWLYQPTGFTLGNEIGSYSDLQALCTEADRYGVKIIVDVVANHLAGSNNGNLANSVETEYKNNKSAYFHNLGAKTSDNDRYEVTQKNIGMPDLNSENTAIQNKVYAMAEQLIAAGVDGIRWDAAKHIALPSEDWGGSFWSKMAQLDIYQYGEILDAPAGSSPDSVNDPLMREYASYIGVTDSRYSTDFMASVRNGSIYKTAGYWNKKNIAADRIVYWAESHDTYSNNGGWTKDFSQNLIDKAYAILGARAESQALYLSRPSETRHEYIYYGKKGSTHFTSPEVAAVNHFHNAMNGAGEKYYTNANCYVVSRSDGASTGGAVIVSMKSANVDVSVSNSGSMVPEGTYTDEVSGSTFTVTATKIIGHIGDTGIAVIYQTAAPAQEVIIGDTNLNGEIEIDDATYIQQNLAMIRELSAVELAAADTDQNGMVEVTDATAIQRYLAKLTVRNSHIGEVITVSG